MIPINLLQKFGLRYTTIRFLSRFLQWDLEYWGIFETTYKLADLLKDIPTARGKFEYLYDNESHLVNKLLGDIISDINHWLSSKHLATFRDIDLGVNQNWWTVCPCTWNHQKEKAFDIIEKGYQYAVIAVELKRMATIRFIASAIRVPEWLHLAPTFDNEDTLYLSDFICNSLCTIIGIDNEALYKTSAYFTINGDKELEQFVHLEDAINYCTTKTKV